MSEISVIGLGSMGAALAQTLLSTGHAVSVWNRSQEKAELLVADDAEMATSVADAVARSPIIMICIDNYTTTRGIFSTDPVISLLTGCRS